MAQETLGTLFSEYPWNPDYAAIPVEIDSMGRPWIAILNSGDRHFLDVADGFYTLSVDSPRRGSITLKEKDPNRLIAQAVRDVDRIPSIEVHVDFNDVLTTSLGDFRGLNRGLGSCSYTLNQSFVNLVLRIDPVGYQMFVYIGLELQIFFNGDSVEELAAQVSEWVRQKLEKLKDHERELEVVLGLVEHSKGVPWHERL